MKKIFSIIICLMLALSMAIDASAATIDMLVAGVDTDNERTVHVTVVYGSPEEAQQSTLLVIKEGENIVTAPDSSVRHIAQKSVTGNTVKYEFNMATGDRVGTYDLYVGGSKIDAPDSTKITFDMTNATTIRFAANGTEILPSVLVSANIGEALDLTPYGEDTVEYEGVMYKRDGTNAATYTPTAATGEVTISYTLDDVATIEKVSATVIEGNSPILPMTLDAITAEGVNTTVTISAWDLSNLVPGENTVYGTCNETSKLAEATVTVLPLSFELPETTSKGKADNNITFTEDMYAFFRIEFDMVINAVSDTGANFGYNGTKWGSGAFGISPNGGNLKLTGGNKSGTSDGGTTIKSGVKAGETYRILVEADPVTDTVSVYATASDGTIYSVLDKTFRKEQSPDAINTINLRGNNVADGGLTLKNIKVCAAPLVDVTFVNTKGEIVKSVQCNANESMTYTVSACETYYASEDGTAAIYAIPETTVTGQTEVTVYPAPNKYAVLEDAYVEGGQVKGIGKAYPTYHVFVASAGGDDRGPIVDADGVSISTATPSTLGSTRVGFFQFPVVDAGEGQSVYANFYVTSWHGNTFSNSNKSIRLAGYAVNDSTWAEAGELGSYTSATAPLLEGFEEAMFTPSYAYVADYITLDVTEPMKKAKELGLETLTIRLNAGWGAAYIAERESCVAGEAFEGLASYLSIIGGGKSVTVTGADKVTKNGSIVTNAAEGFTVAEGDSVKMYSDDEGIVAFTDGSKVYAVTDGVTAALDPLAGEYAPATAGVEMVQGAQVRVGGGVDEATGKVGEGSGLRFITTVDYTDSLANIEGATYGVKITAEGSSAEAVDIPAEKWQTEGEVYTSAITNLAEGNFNRNFTATAYITVDGQTFLGNSVTRSVYQVARGLLAGGFDGNYGESADENGKYDELSEELLAVLNAYVNQTGIRLGFSTEGLSEYTGTNGAYSGDGAFFEVSDAAVNGTIYTIKLTPVGQAVIDTTMATEYVRINNNNSAIKTLVTVTDNNDGTYTLTFDASTLIK
ncbi:MAG: hypothetical protein IJ435_05045 [Clostridia bacterium]|nr:hypothetical protein [Clostridia bacterium]